MGNFSRHFATRKKSIIIFILSVAFLVAFLLRWTHRTYSHYAKNFSHQAASLSQLSDYNNSKEDSEALFAGFDNENGMLGAIVPDFVHYIFFGQSGPLDFTSFLSILSVIKIHKPAVLYFHSDAPLNSKSKLNRYWEIIHNVSTAVNVSVQERHLPRPSHVYGQRLSSIWHATDIARIRILQQYGGITLDRDQLVLKPLHKFRKFEMTLGWPEDQYIGTQLLIAHPKARLLSLWLESYRRYKPSMWYYNAAQLPTQQILSSRPELVHREKWSFGVHNIATKLYGEEEWTEWRDYYAVHLLSRHKYLLSKIQTADNTPVNEHSIQSNPTPFGAIARFILYQNFPETLDMNNDTVS